MLKQGLNQKLLQKLSPQQIQFIQLLQLNTAEFEQRLEEEMESNPALEENNYADEDSEETFESAEEEPEFEENELYDDVDIEEYLPDDDTINTYTPRDPNIEDKDIPVASAQSLYERLSEQLSSVKMDDRKEQLLLHLIGMIDEDGYLRRPLKNIAYDLAFLNNIKTNEEELEDLLKVIQSFEPAGIGARDLRECLLIQLERKKEKNDETKLAYKIISNYMDELGNKHYEKLMRSLKVDREELKDALAVITHLNPKPGESQSSAKVQYVTPDFLVTSDEDNFVVTLNSRNSPQLNVSQQYQETLKGYKESKEKPKQLKDQVQFIKQKLDSAKWFIDAIKQRQHTLLLTMRTIVDIQKEFFKTGDFTKLKPMVLKDVAERIGMDISTVSRVASSKYVQTDFGIFSLKEFFSEGIQTAEGEEVSNREVKMILKEIIDNEDKNKPLTDEKLTQMLNDRGYNIARRTIAKYREQMNLPVARLRKHL